MILPVDDPVYQILARYGSVRSFKRSKEAATVFVFVKMSAAPGFAGEGFIEILTDALDKADLPGRRPEYPFQIVERQWVNFQRQMVRDFCIIWQVEREPEQVIKPEIRYPDALSDDAMILLQQLHKGVKFTVKWAFREAQPLLNGKAMSEKLWNAFQTELEQRGITRYYDGYAWTSIDCVQYPYTESVDIEANKDYLVVEHRLNKVGTEFIKTHERMKDL